MTGMIYIYDRLRRGINIMKATCHWHTAEMSINKRFGPVPKKTGARQRKGDSLIKSTSEVSHEKT